MLVHSFLYFFTIAPSMAPILPSFFFFFLFIRFGSRDCCYLFSHPSQQTMSENIIYIGNFLLYATHQNFIFNFAFIIDTSRCRAAVISFIWCERMWEDTVVGSVSNAVPLRPGLARRNRSEQKKLTWNAWISGIETEWNGILQAAWNIRTFGHQAHRQNIILYAEWQRCYCMGRLTDSKQSSWKHRSFWILIFISWFVMISCYVCCVLSCFLFHYYVERIEY